MKKVLTMLMILAFCLIPLIIAAQEGTSTETSKAEDGRKEGRPRISVKTFENPASFYDSTIGNGITDILITKLVQSGRFNVIARHESFEELKDEIDLGSTGYIEQETKTQKGYIKGVDYILMGKVTNFGYKEDSKGLGGAIPGFGGNIGVSSQKAEVKIDFRLVDSKTGETIIAETASASEKHSGADIGAANFGDWIGNINFETQEFQDSMIGKATVKAIEEISKKMIEHFPLTGAILAVTSGKIVIDLGEGAGLKEGQKLKVIRENVIRDSDGNEVFREETEIGIVEIDKIQLKSSLAKVVSGCSDVKEGDIVRGIEEPKKDDKKSKDKKD